MFSGGRVSCNGKNILTEVHLRPCQTSISWVSTDILHNILGNVKDFRIYYTMFVTTPVVRCSQYSLIFFISTLVWIESPGWREFVIQIVSRESARQPIVKVHFKLTSFLTELILTEGLFLLSSYVVIDYSLSRLLYLF